MANLLELLATGFGQPRDTPVRVESRSLTWTERRRVQRLVRRGEAAWDVRSARYAVELARVTERAQSFLSPGASRVVLVVITLAAALLAAGDWVDDGLSVGAVFYTVVAVGMAYVAWRSPEWTRNAPRAREANQALLGQQDDAAAVRPAPAPRSRGQERLGFALAIALMAVLFGGGMFVGDDDSLPGALVGGLIFGAIFVPLMRHMARRTHAAVGGAGDGAHVDRHDPPTPVAVEVWGGLSSRWRLGLRVVGTIFAALLLWIMAMAETQLSTCDTTEGGLATADQTGFTRGFCGSPGADVASVVVTYLLVAALPLAGLVLGVFAAARRTGAARWSLLGVAAVLIALPVVLAWLLAGAH